MSERDDALGELRDSTPRGWWVGLSMQQPDHGEWLLYAYDLCERPIAGPRARLGRAVAASEVGVIREMARCLREIKAGRVPK